MRLSIFLHGLLSLIYLYLGWWDVACQLHSLLQSKCCSISLAWTESSSEGRWSQKTRQSWWRRSKDSGWLLLPSSARNISDIWEKWFLQSLNWMAMQLVTDLYYCGFVVFRVIAFTEQAHPLLLHICFFLDQGFTRNRCRHVVVCLGRKFFTILEFEPCWSVVLWIDRKKYMEVWGETRNVWTHLSFGGHVCCGYIN